MNRRMVAYVLGRILMVEALLMIPSVIVGFVCGEGTDVLRYFLIPIIGLALLGFLLSFKKPKNTAIYSKDGLFVTAAAWVLMSLAGALPFLFTGIFESFWDCIFEIVSGFTTTGASVLSQPELLPKSVLFWRSFSHWIGGMGVLVFVLAILPLSEDRSLHLMRAESPGPVVGKLVPRMRDTAMILYGVYTALTIILIVMLICGGMSIFDSFCYAFGTAGTGGFAPHSASFAIYNSAYIEIVISVFMLLFGVNFSVYYMLLIGNFKKAFKNEELWSYLIVAAAAILIIFIDTLPIYEHNIGYTLRTAFFQVSSIMTTTGFATADFANVWPQLSQHLLLLLMIFGACAGSTGGGIKHSRILLLVKSSIQEIKRLLHPRMKTSIRIDGASVDIKTVHDVRTYLLMYVIIIIISTLLLSLDNADVTTNLSAELACFNNIGPGLGAVGPMSNYAAYSPFSKMLLSLNMLFGRLEILPMIVFLSPRVWKKSA